MNKPRFSMLVVFLEKHERLLLWGIVLTAFLVRILWALISTNLDPVLRNNPLHGDALPYYNLAENMLNGYGYTFTGLHPTAFRMPGYPLFLAGIFQLSNFSLATVRIAQAFLGALTIIPVFWIARGLGGSILGLLAALGTAFHPILIYMVSWIYSETLFIFISWLAIWMLVRLVEKFDKSAALLAGLGFGIASLIRPEIVLFPLFSAAVLIVLKHITWQQTVKLLFVQMIAIFVILPWSLRNILLFQSFVPLTTSAGLNFHAGNNPDSDGGSAFQYLPEGLPEPEADRILLNESLDWIKSHPKKAIESIPKKVFKFFSPIEFETQSVNFNRLSIIINLFYWAFLSIGLFGLWIHRDQTSAVIILALLLWYLLNAIIFFGGSRVALPVSPGLMILAAGGVLGIVHWHKAGSAAV